MRSFKSKLLSACAWAAPILSAALPGDYSVARTGGEPSQLELDLQDNYAQATFRVPCVGCLGEEATRNGDESLLLRFEAFIAYATCGSSNTLRVNGIQLFQDWNGDSSYGSGSFSHVAEPEWYSKYASIYHDLDLEWWSACLTPRGNDIHSIDYVKDAVQVLTVTIKAIDGKRPRLPAGFTISFKQTSPPELLRIEATPSHSAIDPTNAQFWRSPDPQLRIISPSPHNPPPSSESSDLVSLEGELRELKALQTVAQKLKETIKQKEDHINSQLHLQSDDLQNELRHCQTYTCILKHISQKAHGALNKVYTSFHKTQGSKMGRPNDPYAQTWRPSDTAEATIKINDHDSPPIYISSLPPSALSSNWRSDTQSRRPLSASHPAVIALEIFLGLLCCGCFAKLIRAKCCSVRTKSERAAHLEEQRNVQAPARSTRRKPWSRNWWQWRRSYRLDKNRIADYEEKRALINQQEHILEEAMQEEFRQLRTAHGMVNYLFQAQSHLEEGLLDTTHPHSSYCAGNNLHCRCHNHYPSDDPPSPTSSVFTRDSMGESLSRPLSRTSSLPGYHSDATAPPAYESDEDISEYVANGFMSYTSRSRASTGSTWTPASSIIDVSPRFSAETLRTVYADA